MDKTLYPLKDFRRLNEIIRKYEDSPSQQMTEEELLHLFAEVHNFFDNVNNIYLDLVQLLCEGGHAL